MAKKKQNRPRVGTLIALVALVTVLLILGVLAAYFFLTARAGGARDRIPAQQSAAAQTTVPVETETVETEPPAAEPLMPVAAANGDSVSILCRASYSAGAEPAAAEQIAARAGSFSLTNGELQIYYLSEVSAYRASNAQIRPDFSLPLDCQLCPLGEASLSWQHYFLQRAIRTWQAQAAMLQASQEPQPITEEAFLPNFYQDLHGPNVAPDLPVNDFLYADQPCYKPNEVHQAYLDELEVQLDAQAMMRGYENLADFAAKAFGSGVTAQQITNAAIAYNTAYMYFTERSFYVEVAEEELQAKLESDGAQDAYTVDMRHILLIPDGASVAADGKVTADDAQWKACEESAKKVIHDWLNEFPTNMIADGKNINFSRYAFRNSADAGSNANGGLYSGVQRGMLIAELDDWCFDPARKPNDYVVLRSEVGVHIVFFVRSNSTAQTDARMALRLEQERSQWEAEQKKMKLTADYGAVSLWADTTADGISLEDVLYPDVAHERYPKAMVFFQQDYPTTSYGSSYVSRGGCGVTTMAMLSTYLTDDLHTPAMLAKVYPRYHDENGTKAEMFLYVPAELGFQLIKQTHKVDEAIQALKENKRVVSLQQGGHFTSAGHYLLLQEYYEENDTFQVRDSNIANYGKLDGHKVDYFTRADIVSGGTNFFIFPEKVTRIPACTRCGDACAEQEPALLLRMDYYCEKCRTAMERRYNFLTILDEFSAS